MRDIKHNILRQKIVFFGIMTVVGLIAIVSLALLAQPDATQQKQIYKVTQEEFDQNFNRRKHFYTASDQDINDRTLTQDIHVQLLNKMIIEDYAASNNISVNEEDIESYYQQRVARYASEQELLRGIERLYNIDKEQYRASIHYDLLREAVQSTLSIPLTEWLAEHRSQSQLVVDS